ncbi:hypothetical protein [Candidatus Synchoanobacter obligatus]|uniref:Uncharacterized protein n=1 Tax=Candidatus Synchoanobacter obligatus TaxID=2919597 RepID=A0ABT1L782_9GAMM|nr:hypothetical protein [Candidatus Synchoanobacter obligatus]MCP8352228.1 hypothetical protein [Candidatus Synchoanobacter obligatus]
MGYDITLHPISKEQVNHYVLEPFYNRALVESRINALSTDEDTICFLKETYDDAYESSDSSQHIDCLALSHLAACVSSYIHSYWYSRNVCFSFLIKDNLCPSIFQPLSTCTNDSRLIRRMRHKKFHIVENYMCSGFAPEDKISELADSLIPSIQEAAKRVEGQQLDFVKSQRTALSYVKIMLGSGQEITTPFDEPLGKIEDLLSGDTLWGMKQVLNYCKKHNLGLIEASDLVIPVVDSSAGNPDNFNAAFLNTPEE